jgi:hypothetical protein
MLNLVVCKFAARLSMVNSFMLETYCLHIHSSEDVAILSNQLSKILSDKTGTTYNNSAHMNYHPYGDTDLY